MGKITGFLEHDREEPPKRPAGERVRDFRELELPVVQAKLEAAESMGGPLRFE